MSNPLWQGLITGVGTRDRSSAPQPQAVGYTSAISQGLYWLGFQFTNAIVYGPKK